MAESKIEYRLTEKVAMVRLREIVRWLCTLCDYVAEWSSCGHKAWIYGPDGHCLTFRREISVGPPHKWRVVVETPDEHLLPVPHFLLRDSVQIWKHPAHSRVSRVRRNS